MKEIELKLLLDPATLPRLRRHPALAAMDSSGSVTADLTTVYFDTESGALAERGIALRLRREGPRWTQTVKRGRRIRGGLSEALELSVPATGPVPELGLVGDAGMRAEIEATLAGAPILPVFETEIRRATYRLRPDGLGEVELALDEGVVRAGNKAEALAEAEIELVSGSVRAVFAAARRLFRDGGLSFSTLSKAERGGLLAETGTIRPPCAPRNAAPVALGPTATAEGGAREILAECFEQITANIAQCRADDDPEGPHQLRVGLRRLRSAILLFRPVIGGPALDHLDQEARWLSHEAGRLRDLDVAVDQMLAEAMAEPDADPGFAPLRVALERRRQGERAQLRRTLVSARVHGFLFDLAETPAARLWIDPGDYEQTARLAQPMPAAAAAALDARLAKATKRAKHIETLDTEARHALRRELKKLRYAVEFCAPLFDARAVKPFLKRLKSLQEVFGDLNDLAMAESLFLDPEGPASASIPAARAAGRLIGARSERARASWERAKASWKALNEAPAFWR